MSEVLSAVWEWRFVIICLVAVVLYAVLEWEKFKATLFEAMLTAKRMAKDKVLNSGKQQEDWVVERLWIVLPARVKLFINKDRLREAVHWLYTKAKDKLDDGYWNGSVK